MKLQYCSSLNYFIIIDVAFLQNLAIVNYKLRIPVKQNRNSLQSQNQNLKILVLQISRLIQCYSPYGKK